MTSRDDEWSRRSSIRGGSLRPGERMARGTSSGMVCPDCGLKLSPLLFDLHRIRESGELVGCCVPESELASLGAVRWKAHRPEDPPWYTLPPHGLRRASVALWEALWSGGEITAWQALCVPVMPGRPETLRDLEAALLKARFVEAGYPHAGVRPSRTH